MGLLDSIKDHIMIGGPNAIAGWGSLVLFTISGGVLGGRIIADVKIFIPILVAAAITGNGIYALNAYYDVETDKLNKPGRPLPSGRMTPQHALKYSQGLMALGLFISLVASIVTGKYLMLVLWTMFTLLGIAYSMPPLKLKSRHILGNLCFAAFTTITMFIPSLWGTPLLMQMVLYKTFFGTLMVTAIIVMKDFADYDGDKATGSITLPVKIGKKKSAVFAMVVMAIVVIIRINMFPPANTLELIKGVAPMALYIASFGVYIVLEYIGPRTLSYPYAEVQYYFIALWGAYSFLKMPLGLNLITWVEEWDYIIAFSIYAVLAFTTIYLAKKGTLGPKWRPFQNR